MPTTAKSFNGREAEIDELYSKGPVRRGPFYCSPWCGANCTIAAYDAACFKGKALAEQLGPNWKPRIWENMGWYYCAIDASGYWKVHAHEYADGDVHYTAFLGEPGSAGGKWAESGKTPQAAIEKTKHVARAALRELRKVIDASLVNSGELYLRTQPRKDGEG
ncbi:MAG TPA: hypothetical protein VL866_24340 [Pyrinomonadaceae bacterium]|nr:hypothetical protein [Pyrinomonadaceae bacterium]